MKKFLSILMIALIASFAITSCDGGDTATLEGGPAYNSSYFADVISSQTGEFIGLDLGDSKEIVKSTLPANAFADETESYLSYYWELDEHQYNLDLYFDENDKLNSIDGDVYFYDADGNYDVVEAAAFYADMQSNFKTKYGVEKEMPDYLYTSWNLDTKVVEVGLDNGKVHWYIYSNTLEVEDDGSTNLNVRGAPAYNSSYFADVMSSQTGEFIGLDLGDSREIVKSILPANAFADETESYLYYYWELDEHQYNLDLYFDENDRLNSIDGDVYFYDADGNYDVVEAAAFYADMQSNFTSKYGVEEEMSDDDYIYTSWFFDTKEVKVGLDNGGVYWYIYSYEDMNM